MADVIGVSTRSAALMVPQESASAAAAVYRARQFASGSEGTSLRRSADQHLQDGAPESQPRPDSTAINQKAPLSADEHGEPQVGKVSTPEGDDESSPKISSADLESDDVVPNMQMPKDE